MDLIGKFEEEKIGVDKEVEDKITYIYKSVFTAYKICINSAEEFVKNVQKIYDNMGVTEDFIKILLIKHKKFKDEIISEKNLIYKKYNAIRTDFKSFINNKMDNVFKNLKANSKNEKSISTLKQRIEYEKERYFNENFNMITDYIEEVENDIERVYNESLLSIKDISMEIDEKYEVLEIDENYKKINLKIKNKTYSFIDKIKDINSKIILKQLIYIDNHRDMENLAIENGFRYKWANKNYIIYQHRITKRVIIIPTHFIKKDLSLILQRKIYNYARA